MRVAKKTDFWYNYPVKHFSLALLILFLLPSAALAGEISVAAAANVQYALEELKTVFEKVHPDIHLKTIYNTAGELAALVAASLELTCPTCGTVTRLA